MFLSITGTPDASPSPIKNDIPIKQCIQYNHIFIPSLLPSPILQVPQVSLFRSAFSNKGKHVQNHSSFSTVFTNFQAFKPHLCTACARREACKKQTSHPHIRATPMIPSPETSVIWIQTGGFRACSKGISEHHLSVFDILTTWSDIQKITYIFIQLMASKKSCLEIECILYSCLVLSNVLSLVDIPFLNVCKVVDSYSSNYLGLIFIQLSNHGIISNHLLVGAQPPIYCSFARHLVGKMEISVAISLLFTKHNPVKENTQNPKLSMKYWLFNSEIIISWFMKYTPKN